METIVFGSVGNQIVLATAQDLTEATALKMVAVKPDGSTVTWTATAHATAGSIARITQAGDLDQAGEWLISAYIEWGSTSKHTSPMPYRLLVVAPGTYFITTTEIRNAINIPEASELSELAINSAIDRAQRYFKVLGNQYTAPIEFLNEGQRAYAIYLAYQSYADRVLNVPPGAYEQGKWSPIAEEIVRDTSAKLQGLRQLYEDFEKMIKAYPTRPLGIFQFAGSTRAKTFSFGMYDYESQESSDF
jgi:hypothetical protein